MNERSPAIRNIPISDLLIYLIFFRIQMTCANGTICTQHRNYHIGCRYIWCAPSDEHEPYPCYYNSSFCTWKRTHSKKKNSLKLDNVILYIYIYIYISTSVAYCPEWRCTDPAPTPPSPTPSFFGFGLEWLVVGMAVTLLLLASLLVYIKRGSVLRALLFCCQVCICQFDRRV